MSASSGSSNKRGTSDLREVSTTTEHSPKPRRVVHEVREARLFLPEAMDAKAIALDSHGDTHQFKIINISAFGARIIGAPGTNPLHLNQALPKLTIIVNGTEAFSAGAVVVNESATANGPTYGVALEGYGIDIDRLQAAVETRNKYENLIGTSTVMDISRLVRPEFKVHVANLNVLFQDLKMRLIEEEERIKDGHHSESYRRKLEEAAIDLAMSLYQNEIQKVFQDFQPLVENLSAEDRLIHKRFFRINFHPLVLSAPFVRRAYSKPLGYAGDFGLMIMFYDYNDEGSNLFEKFIHRFACNEPSSVANKNRVEYLCEQLRGLYLRHCETKPKGTVFKVSSIASGPAREVEMFIREQNLNPDFPVHLILIDQEAKALEYAASKLRPIISSATTKLTLLAEDAVLGIIKNRPFCEIIQNSDCIISAGLFDYLSDRVATRLIQSLYEALNRAGHLFIGNVSRKSPDRFSMEFLMEWQLVLRDETDLRRLVEPLHLGKSQVDVVSEALGLNLFLKVAKGA